MEIFKIIKSALAQKTLAYFFTNPEKNHYVRELAEILDTDAGNLSKELKKLEGEGILKSNFFGNQKYFSLNKDYALFGELSGMVEKTIGVTGAFRQELSKIKGISKAFIYGSWAKKKTDYASDIDLFIIGKFNEDELLRAVNVLEKRLGREINYVFYSKETLRKMKKTDSFVKSVFDGEKVLIIGEKDEF